MTTKIITSYLTAFVAAIAIMLIGISFAYASEVTGTLSSDTVTTSPTGGSLSGTVSSDTNTSGGSSGGSSSGRSSGSSNSPAGSVLGASTDNLSAPAFPNAGFAPDEIK